MTVAAQLDDVTVEYRTALGTVRAVDRATLVVPRATSTAIVGRSGSGKSTLVSLLALLRRPTTGTVVVDGVDVSTLDDGQVAALRAEKVGIVFQAFHLDPLLTAADNVALPWYFRRGGRRRAAARSRAHDVLDALGIADLARRRPFQMSGGQRQRVAIARALFTEPRIFIADEPTGNLDEDTANTVADLLLGLPATFGTAVVLVTHDAAVAARAGTVLELSRGRLDAGDITP